MADGTFAGQSPLAKRLSTILTVKDHHKLLEDNDFRKTENHKLRSEGMYSLIDGESTGSWVCRPTDRLECSA